jgi:hypothetical protein
LLSSSTFSPTQLQLLQIGDERSPLLVIDDFYPQPATLIAAADNLQPFMLDPSNFYPGLRKISPADYQQYLLGVMPELVTALFAATAPMAPQPVQPQILQSAFAMTTLTPQQLRPIQMLPHFDSVEPGQLAMVHYLCDASFGGTSFYQHRQTGFERIDASRLIQYSSMLKVEAQAAQLHLTPAYHRGDSTMFRCIHQVPARFNRAILYPANLLHSGDINASLPAAACPSAGRLTLSNFIRLQPASAQQRTQTNPAYAP